MLKKEVLNNIILALLIYLPTCAFIPVSVYLILIAYSVLLNFSYLKLYFSNLFRLKVTDKPLTFLISFAIIAFILRLSDYSHWQSIKGVYSFAYLFPFTYIVAKTISVRRSIFNYLIYFVLFEVAFGFLEYILGVSTIFTGLNLYREFGSYDLLYYTRVFGLSSNSSGLGLKFVMALLLISISPIGKIKKLIFECIILCASLITFGRIAIIAIVFYYLLKLFDGLIIKKNFNKFDFIPITIFVIFFSVNPTWTKAQFTRNHTLVNSHRIDIEQFDDQGNVIAIDNITEELGIDKIDMAGRNEIWNNFLSFGVNHLMLGNKGKKYMLRTFHAHNSYIEIFASFGLVLFFYLLFIFGFNLNKTNYVMVISMMFLAFGQYLIFWGISFFDIIFYYFIFFYKPKDEKH